MAHATRYVFAATIFVALTAPSLLFCEIEIGDVAPPTDTPTGGIAVDPGVLTCGEEAGSCDTNEGGGAGCCSGPGAANGGVCTGDGEMCPVGTGLVTCNETADCNRGPNGGELPCCATIHADGGYLGARCSTSALTCPAPTLQLCRTNTECPGGECVVQSCPDGRVYEMCGLSTSPGFVCKYYLSGSGG